MKSRKVWILALLITYGGIIPGYYNNAIGGIIEMEAFQNNFPAMFPEDNDMTNDTEAQSNSTDHRCSSGSGDSRDFLVGWFISIGSLSSVIGSIFSGKLADIFSRKLILVSSGLTHMTGSLLLALSLYNATWMPFLGRAIVGVSQGVFYLVMPIYISEMSSRKRRGLMVSLMILGSAVGTIIGLMSNVGFEKFSEGWRITCSVVSLGDLIFATGFLLLPYTPRWLVLKNRKKEAFKVFSSINYNLNEKTMDAEFKDVTEEKEKERTKVVVKELLQWKYISRFATLFMILLMMTQMCVLQNYYPVTLFCLVGVSQPFTVSIIIGPIKLVATFVLTVFIDQIGRKTLLSISGAVSIVTSIIVGILMNLYGSGNSLVNYIVVALICVTSFFYYVSWVFIPWIIACEVFPLKIKGIALAILFSCSWVFSFVAIFYTPRLVGPPLYLHGYMYFSAFIYLLATLLVLLAIPETKGISLERIDEVYSQHWTLRICALRNTRNEDSEDNHIVEKSSLLKDKDG